MDIERIPLKMIAITSTVVAIVLKIVYEIRYKLLQIAIKSGCMYNANWYVYSLYWKRRRTNKAYTDSDEKLTMNGTFTEKGWINFGPRFGIKGWSV